MKIHKLVFCFALFYLFAGFYIIGQVKVPFACTLLTEKGDLSSLMVEGIDRFLCRETDKVRERRSALWQFNFSNAESFASSVASNREFLAVRVGIADPRTAPGLEVLTSRKLQQLKAETTGCTIRAVRWNVLEGLQAEGLLLQPKSRVKARVVIIPDADIMPEVLAGLQDQYSSCFGIARRLSEEGMEILIPVLASRDDTFSGSTLLNRYTNQPHREWIYRQGYEVGRHVIGYELQKIFAAIDWMEMRNREESENVLIGVAGYGEGGLLALYASALDQRISSTLVSGYFDRREELWSEPIYRNVFGLLRYFGDAELAMMSWPRRLVVEHSSVREVSGPPSPGKGRTGAAPGRIVTPELTSADGEIRRATAMIPQGKSHLSWIHGKNGNALKPFSDEAVSAFAGGLNIDYDNNSTGTAALIEAGEWVDLVKRQEKTVRGMEQHVQYILSICERTRDRNFWETLKGDSAAQRPVKAAHRERFRDVIGRLPVPSMPASPKARLLQTTDKWTGYEVTLDVWPDVFAWGILLIPNNIKKGEKRPAVVCQHGLEGLPVNVVITDPNADCYRYYKGFASKLADKGYVVFAPHNPYRGFDKFRVLQRKANPIGLTLFSVITGQHQRIVEWLGQQTFVDRKRIGFYGLSYGGKTAMRVPALVEDYALSICSGDFYEWVRYNASTKDASYMFTGEYEIFEWDLGHTFNYAEMAALIAPRPFMVERGYLDNAPQDEWVSYEFEKVSRHYDFLNLPGLVSFEHFMGPHTINGVGTFEFLDRHLNAKSGVGK